MAASAEDATGHVSPLQIAALRMGVATAEERAHLDRHLAACGTCRARADSWHQAEEEFARDVLPRTLPSLRQRRQQARQGRAWWWAGGLAVPAAALAGVLLVRLPASTPTPVDDQPAFAVKGGASLTLAARRGQRVFRPGPNDPVRAHDQIRFVVEGNRQPYVLVASIDGAGKATIYVPYDGARSTPLPAGEHVELEGSIILDASPGPERIFAFFSAQPIEAAPVRAALTAVGAKGAAAIRATTTLDVGAEEQSSVMLEKTSEGTQN